MMNRLDTIATRQKQNAASVTRSSPSPSPSPRSSRSRRSRPRARPRRRTLFTSRSADVRSCARAHARHRQRHRSPARSTQADADAVERDQHQHVPESAAEISMLLAYEVCRDMPTTLIEIETPIATTMAPMLDGKKIVIDLDPARRQRHPRRDARRSCRPRASATSACIAITRRSQAVEYFYKVPDNMGDRDAIVVDPMLATGNSAVAAVDAHQGERAALDQVRVPARRAPRASRRSTTRIPTCRCTRPPSTSGSTRRATSSRASATPAIACSARSRFCAPRIRAGNKLPVTVGT